MNEARNVLNSTNSERSRLKNSAYHKKNGSAVQKLGNKRMSWQEIQSRHGKEKTYKSTDCFMEYSDFEELPSDLKVEFVNKMMDRYDIQMCHLSKYLFNKGDDGLKANLRQIFTLIDEKNVRLLDLCNYKKPRAMTGLLRFQADVEDWRKRTKIAEILDREAEEARKNAPAEFTTYDKYKALNDEDKLDYINKLIRQWGVSPEVISVELFKKSRPTIRAYLNKLGYGEKIIKIGRRTPDSSLAINGRFHNAVQQWEAEMNQPREESVDMKALGTVTEEEPVKEPAVDIQPIHDTSAKEEPVIEVASDRKVIKMPSDDEFVFDRQAIVYKTDSVINTIEQKMKELEERINEKINKPLTSDEILEREGIPIIPLEFKTGWFQPAEEPEPAPSAEPDPMEYHQMHFSTNYISSEINMDEIYAIAAFFKRSKRVKVSIDISEV